MAAISTRKASAAAAGLGLAGILVLSSGLAVGVTALSATEASAQGFFSWWDAPPRPRKPVQRPRRMPAMSATEEKAAIPNKREKDAQGPLIINVSLRRQRVTVYDAEGEVTEAPVSSGRVGYPTPTGVFTILEKKKIHFSNLYDDAPMPNMQRITWSGVALHAGQLPGYPASHGCIRLPYGFSKKLYGMTKLATRVIVSRDPVTPVPITHERLFAAFPPEDETASTMPLASTQVADASDSTVPMPPARPSYRERRLAELAQLDATLRTAGYRKMETEIAAVQAAKAAKVTRLALNKAKVEEARLARVARKAAGERDSVAREIAALTRSIDTSTRMTERQRARASERRAALEARLPGLEATAAAAEAERAEAAVAVAAADGPAAADEAVRKEAAEKYMRASADLAAAVAADEAAKRREAKRALPVSVFISRATQRLYIRQGYEPILDVPVEFAHPDQPVGTHVFTAHDYTSDKTGMTWTVASIAHTPPAKTDTRKKERDRKAVVPPQPVPATPPLPQTAAAALERVTVPEEVREQIADVMKPGSSLIISDNKISGETGKYTDFIILTR